MKERSPAARRVVKAVEAFGFHGLTPERLVRPETLVFLGREPFRIDILTSIDGVTWSEAWAGRKVGMLSTVRVAFLGGEQLVLNEVAAGRPQDIADLALLAEIGLRPPRKRRHPRGRRLDRGYFAHTDVLNSSLRYSTPRRVSRATRRTNLFPIAPARGAPSPRTAQ